MRGKRRAGEFGVAGVYLRELASSHDVGPGLSVSYSDGARRRAGQLSAWLAKLQRGAAGALAPKGRVRLMVASSHDWHKVCGYPYGLPFTRNEQGVATVVVAADYSERFLNRFDDLLLAAGHAGVVAPGPLVEFLDLLVGHEWGHALANVSGLRTYLRWLDELLATYLFVQALRVAGEERNLELLTRWAEVQVAAGQEGAAGGWPLDGFEYPRGRTPLPRLLWYQGVLTRRALELSETRGWDFPLSVGGALPTADRGELARKLVAVEPSFKPWFAVFGDGSQPLLGPDQTSI